MTGPRDNPLDYIDDYLHGLLSPEEAAAVERYCRETRVGQVALEEARRRYAALTSAPAAEVSESLIRQTLEYVHMKATRREKFRKVFRRTVLWVTAASVLIIGALNAYFYRLEPSPYDLRLLGQAELLADSGAALRLAVFDRRSGQPVGGVPIQVALFDPQQREEAVLANVTTDESGIAGPQVELPDWDDGRYQLRVTARTPGGTERLTEAVRIQRQWRLMLSTDKPIYQPGQTIRIRSLALKRPDLRPVAGREVVFTITDPRGNVIFKQRDVTSRFGIAAVDCPLAAEIIEGAYTITCQVGGVTSEQTVTVEKYVLPKFKVEVALDQPFYAPGDPVSGSVQADYFFGKPVTGAEVQIEVRGTDVRQYVIATLTETTDETGKADFRFVLPGQLVGREQESGDARFLLVATVSDTAGQRYSRGVSRVVTANPIRLEILPEAGRLVQGVENTVYVFASYADGRPARVRLLTDQLPDEIETNKLGVASLAITPEAETVALTIRATDDEGRSGRRHVRLTCGRPDGDFLLRPDKAVYDGGETMTLVALGGGVEPVFLDFIKDGQTMLARTLEMQDGRGELQIDLPPDLFGTIRVTAYRFGPEGLAVRKDRTILIRQARELQIHATLDATEYRPGSEAAIRLRITDAEGNPNPGALSLAAVDEAVFSVMSQKSGMEQTFFLLEEEMLQPVYVIYPGWSPELFSELPIGDRRAFEQAILSTTATAVDGAAALPETFRGAEAMDAGRQGGRWLEPPMARQFIDEAMVEVAPDAGFAAPAEARPSAASPFTLAAASFPEKFQRVHQTREQGLVGVTIAWVALAGTLTLLGVVVFAVSYPKLFFILAGIVLAGFCLITVPVGMLLMLSFGGCAAGGPMMALDGAVRQAAPAAAEFGMADLAEAMVPMQMESDFAPEEGSAGPAPPRVRQWFPETLLWRPELVTDDQGEAVLTVTLADSITTWRLSASAVSAEGRLGGADFPIKVFQPFFVDLNLPVSLTRGDEVGVPIVVYNYLDAPQTVTLTVQQADWFERISPAAAAPESTEPAADDEAEGDADDRAEEAADEAGAEKGEEEGAEDEGEGAGGERAAADPPAGDALRLELRPGEIRAVTLPIRVLKVGVQSLEVNAMGTGAADAIRREIEVLPDGVRVEEVVSGSLWPAYEMALDVPPEAIEGSVRCLVKLYPSNFSQLVEGLDAIFQMPYGCFEQTSSTTYPNVLALDYLRRTEKSVPEVEAKARQYIHVGYQRLISFEVPGGGFDWFGNPPANRTLTAYGLLEFEDMARVHDVDPRLIERTRNWLLAQRRPDGRWSNESDMINDGLAGSVLRGADPDLATTAYIAWAVFSRGRAPEHAAATLSYLVTNPPDAIDDPYVLALTAGAIAAIDAKHPRLAGYLERLDAMKKTSDDGKQVWWERSPESRTTFYGSGRAGDIEATAMATLTLLATNQYPASVRGALTWLVAQKDSQGTWHSTQATVLALKALVEGTGKSPGEEQERHIEIALGDETVREVVIPADQAEVMQQIDLSHYLVPGGQYRLQIREASDTGVNFQVVFRHYVPAAEDREAEPSEALAIDIAYDRQRLEVDQTVSAVATVVNRMEEAAPMVILDLPVPGGFVIEPGELAELVGSGKIARFQITPRKAIVYLRQLEPGETLELNYRLRATMPVRVAVPDAEAYEYYNPDRRGRGGATQFEALEAGAQDA